MDTMLASMQMKIDENEIRYMLQVYIVLETGITFRVM